MILDEGLTQGIDDSFGSAKKKLGESNLIIFVRAVSRIMLGWLVNKIEIILSFWVSKSKNKNMDHWVKDICAIVSSKVTCETDQISLLVI